MRRGNICVFLSIVLIDKLTEQLKKVKRFANFRDSKTPRANAIAKLSKHQIAEQNEVLTSTRLGL